MKTLLHWLSLAGLLMAMVGPLAAPLSAQGGFGLGTEQKVTLTARFEPDVARAGETIKLVLKVEVVAGWHAYGKKETTNVPVSLSHDKIEWNGLEAVGEAQIPDGEAHEVFGLSEPQYPLPSSFEVIQLVKVPDGTEPGALELKGAFDYQICDQSSCEPPTDDTFAAELTVEAGEVRPEFAGIAKRGTKPGLQLLPDAVDDKLTLTARFDPAVARPGETVKLVLEAEVAPGWHAYGKKETGNVPVSLSHDKIEWDGLEAEGEAQIPDGEEHEVFGLPEPQYPLPSSFEVVQLVKVPDGTEPGEFTVEGALDYQVCDENSCEPPAEAAFAAELTVEAGEVRAEHVIQAPTKEPFGGLWGLILACIGGGLFALAMPCTYPMIPITFSFFTKQAEARNGNVLSLALTYGLGIIAMFVFVGVGLSSLILPFVNWWVTNLVIGGVFLFFALVLFGWVNLEPPRFVQNFATKAGQVGGLVGVFFMGAALVISSFTCTAPIVGSLIAKVAEFGPLRVGFGMGIFGLTMAIPFVALALMPTKVKAMPRSGEWMETLKISLGFVELAAVLKFVSMVDLALGWQFMNRELFLMMTAAIFALWAMFLFGFLRKAGEPYAGVGPGRQGTGMFVVLVAVYLFSGALGYRLDKYMTSFAPPYSAELVMSRGGHSEAESKYHTIVYDDPARSIVVAKEEDKLLLYNFTGFN
ncbi:MAG: hypothetical protein KDC98_18675 [Planctomycetes bacterium]|nr:hypothetical protein [Planctomycetota bacterium]